MQLCIVGINIYLFYYFIDYKQLLHLKKLTFLSITIIFLLFLFETLFLFILDSLGSYDLF